MKPTHLEISKHFSIGNFSATYEFMSDSIEWDIKGGQTINGKERVISHCEEMKQEMAGSHPTILRHVIQDGNIVVVGSFDYSNEDGSLGRVSFCDLYEFENDNLKKITSFIAESKMQ